MKHLLSLLLLTATLANGQISVQTKAGKPLSTVGEVTNRVATSTRQSALVGANESRQIVQPLRTSTNTAAYINLFNGSVTGNNWRTAPNSTTVAANTLTQITNGPPVPEPGRKYVIRRIIVSSNLPCEVQIQKQYNRAGTLYGATGAITQGTVLQQFADVAVKVDTQNVWKAVFDFPADDPLVVRFGERLLAYYTRAGVQQPNFQISIIGRDKTNSDNEGAPYRGLFIGDSRTGITPDGVAQVQRDFWPFTVGDSLSTYGYPTEPVKIAISGTDASDWDWLARNGRLDGIPFSHWHLNLGTNDVTSAPNVAAFQSGLRTIITKLHTLNPAAPGFVNQIGPTDLTARQANLAAFRSAQAAVVAEMAAKGWPVYLCDISNSFPTTDKSFFVAGESAVGGSTHESSKGQLANAAIIWAVMKQHLNKLKPAK